MSRLDRQISAVQNKLTLDLFLQTAARALLFFGGVGLAYAVWRTLTPWRLPREIDFTAGLLVVTIAWAALAAVRRRPDSLAAATAIDGRLGLNEKFSTALHARAADDAFARAAVLDAEHAAATADVRGHFALHVPRLAGPAVAVIAMAVGVLWLVPPHNLFASTARQPGGAKSVADAERDKAKVEIQKAIAKIDQAPKSAADQTAVQLAKADLQDLLKKPDLAPEAGRRRALSALQELEKAAEQAQKTQTFADAKQADRMLEKMAPQASESGAVADAQRDLSKGDFDGAIKKLNETVDKFDQMTDAQKQAAARQMQQMAKQLQQMASDPKQQQKMQQQLQQAGLSPQQAQQAQKLMQQAAQGNQQAAKQLQQLAQQAASRMNNGQGPTSQQQAQIQQMMRQMQAQANGQQQAQQMQQAAQQMAQSMQQAAGKNPQQADSAKQGQSPQQQQAQQNQQATAGQQQQPMQQAMQSMQQQMQQMQASQQDADQVAAAQSDAADAAAAQQDALNNQPPPATPSAGGGKQNPGRPGGNRAGHGHIAGVATGGQDVPFTVDKKTSPGQQDDKGRMLAGSLVKGDAPKGESKAALTNAAKSAEQDAADEIDSDRVGKQSQKAVRDYFGSMAQ